MVDNDIVCSRMFEVKGLHINELGKMYTTGNI